MRLPIPAATAALLFAAAAAHAQTAPLTSPTPPGVPAAGYEMPGTPVGVPSVQPVGSPVGSRLPTVGSRLPPAGVSPGTPANPFTGNWPSVDPDLVVAPYPGAPEEAPDFLDRLNERFLAMFAPPPPPQTNYFPSLTRRARERREKRERERLELERRWRD